MILDAKPNLLYIPVLEFRAAHSAAQDAVFTDVDPEVIEKLGLFTVQTKCDSKDTYLTRPDLGRILSDEAVQTIKEKCKMHPTVQIYVSDGLSSAAIAANVGDVLPAIEQGLKSYGIDYGTPFFVKYGRVGAMDQISEITGADVTCVLIGGIVPLASPKHATYVYTWIYNHCNCHQNHVDGPQMVRVLLYLAKSQLHAEYDPSGF